MPSHMVRMPADGPSYPALQVHASKILVHSLDRIALQCVASAAKGGAVCARLSSSSGLRLRSIRWIMACLEQLCDPGIRSRIIFLSFLFCEACYLSERRKKICMVLLPMDP